MISKIESLFIVLLLTTNVYSMDVWHEVRSGESLMTISNQHFNTHQCWKEIIKVNPETLAENANIEVGMRLVIPDASTCKKASGKITAVVSKKVINVVKRSEETPLKKFAPVWKESDRLTETVERERPLLEDTRVVSTPAPVPVKETAPHIRRRGSVSVLTDKFDSTQRKNYYIQLKSHIKKELAQADCHNFEIRAAEEFSCHLDLFQHKSGQLYWRVQWGPIVDKQTANLSLKKAREEWQIKDAFIID